MFVGISAQTVEFKKTPPPIQYVQQGDTATFEWDYDKVKYQLVFGAWKRTDSNTVCVSQVGYNRPIYHCGSNYQLQGIATLLIRNVTSSMSGEYGCVLSLLVSLGRPPRDLKSTSVLRVISKLHDILDE